MNRRAVLKALGGGGVVATTGYAALLVTGTEGRVFWRRMAVDTGTGDGALFPVTQRLSADGTTETHVHPAFEGEFGDEVTVSASLHRRLRREYGPGEPYYLLGIRPRNCNGVPGDEGYRRAEVSRETFNDSLLGECVKC